MGRHGSASGMKLPRIRLLKAHPDRRASTVDDAAAVATRAVVAGAGCAPAPVTEPLPRRQPKFPQVRADRTPVDVAVLRKVLDALNERLPLAPLN
jgi:hypothetical protein